MNFPQFLMQKFLEWQIAEGDKRSIKEFAKYLDVKDSALSHWMNEIRKKPDAQSLHKLSLKLGLEVYDVLGLPRPDADLAYISQHWDDVSPEFRVKFREQVEKLLAQNEPKSIHKNRRAHQGS
jgi:transcriptional regulator with XRE-family HTH domain